VLRMLTYGTLVVAVVILLFAGAWIILRMIDVYLEYRGRRVIPLWIKGIFLVGYCIMIYLLVSSGVLWNKLCK